MTVPAGYYDQSYPPSLWAGPASAARRTAAQTPAPAPAGVGAGPGGDDAAGLPSGLTVTAGTPGAYDPPQRPAERPRNLAELRERARPADAAPWPAGAYVTIGESGKRAHWTGGEWRGGESPGYGQAAGMGEWPPQQQPLP